MTVSARFRKGYRKIDVDDADTSGYSVIPDFGISAPVLATTIAAGTALNAIGGVLVNETARDRTYEFPLMVGGDSVGERQAHASKLQAFIRSGTLHDPVYFEVRLHDDYDYAPKWGQQGGYLKYEIITGTVTGPTWDRIAKADYPDFNVRMVLKPYAQGSEQVCLSAIGGVLEDNLFTDDGRSLGTIIPESTTNKMTNPVFSHATYDNGWTTSADLIASENTDTEFLLFGRSSAKITRTASANFSFHQSIDATNTNTHTLTCYAKAPDGSAITASHLRMYYGSAQTTTYTSMGNGWYRLEAEVTGVAASTSTGVVPQAVGQTFYVDGFQLEEKARSTALAHGEMMGCAWTGTAHASTTTRTAARLRRTASDLIDIGAWTIRLVWLTEYANTDIASDVVFYRDSAVTFRLRFLQASDAFAIDDGTNSASSAAQSFSAGDVIVLHATGGPSGINLYRDGNTTAIASDTDYTPPALGTLYIGSNDSAANQVNGTFMGFTTFAREMTSAEVNLDYNNVVEMVNATDRAKKQRVDWLPYIWTKDGDDTVDNANPPNDNPSDLDNFAVVNGVPGTEAADTRIEAELGAGNLGADSRGGLILSLIDHDRFVDPENLIADDNTTASSSNDSGSGFQRTNATTGSGSKTVTMTFVEEVIRMLSNRRVALLARIQDAGSNAQIRLDMGPADFGVSEWKSIDTESNFLMRLTRGLTFPDIGSIINNFVPTTAGVALAVRRTSGSGNLDTDFFMVVAQPLLRIWGSDNNVEEGFIYDSELHRVFAYDSGTTNIPSFKIHKRGDRIRFVPDKVNHLLVGVGDIEGTAMIEAEITDTIVFQKVHLTPRYLLM